MSLTARIDPLIESKKFEEVEELWMTSLEGTPAPAEEYLVLAKKMRKAGERSRSDALLELVAEAFLESARWEERVAVLCEIGRLSKRPSSFREPLEEAVTKSLSDRPTFARVMKAVNFGEKDSNPVEKAERAVTWLRYDEGERFFMSGRGCGVVVELNPELGVCRLDFEEDKRFSVPLGAAPKFLEPIGPDHFLFPFWDDRDAFTHEVLGDPPAALEGILRGFQRPMTAGDVKDTVKGIVPTGKWSSWWTSARKHPQIVASGSGSKATYTWKATSEAADQAILGKFDRANLRKKVDIAKKESGRSQELADQLAALIVEEAERVLDHDPAAAWEALTTLERLPGKFETTIEPDQILMGPGAARVIAAISDRAFREKALDIVRRSHPEWQSIFGEVFFQEQDPRVLTRIMIELQDGGGSEIGDRLIDETARYPRRHPYAFYWYVKSLAEEEELGEKVSFPLVFQVLDALGLDEFSGVRARMKEFFDKGGLAIRVLMAIDNAEQARKLGEAVDRSGELETYRRENIKAAVSMKYPSLQDTEHEPIIATAEAVETKKAEFHHLKNVEMPANLRAIKEARELGDLSENFEYKSARQRQEYLTARVAALDGELRRVRLLDPSQVDPSEVRVGTRVVLRNGDVEREVQILGPWESDPEKGIYSHESDVAKALMGSRPNDIVTFMGNDWVVVAIRRWTE